MGFDSSCAIRIPLEKHQFGVHLEGKNGVRMLTTGRLIANKGRYVSFWLA